MGKPTVLNNVETFANIPYIILKGAENFRKIGTEGSPGTKVFCLVGKVKNVGLIEVEMGITLREVVFEIGGGMINDRPFKAVQTGGPSGGCIPAQYADTAIDFDSLIELGSMMGSGGMVVMDEETCMVDVARYFLDFTEKESCGKCVPCRLGTKQMLSILEDIVEGRGKPGDIELLEELAVGVKAGSLCGLGQTAPNPVLSTIRHFRDEYEKHIHAKKCPAGVCKELFEYVVDEEKCMGCGKCQRNCPQDAIEGERKVVHKISSEKCIKCGICVTVCSFDAEMKV